MHVRYQRLEFVNASRKNWAHCETQLFELMIIEFEIVGDVSLGQQRRTRRITSGKLSRSPCVRRLLASCNATLSVTSLRSERDRQRRLPVVGHLTGQQRASQASNRDVGRDSILCCMVHLGSFAFEAHPHCNLALQFHCQRKTAP